MSHAQAGYDLFPADPFPVAPLPVEPGSTPERPPPPDLGSDARPQLRDAVQPLKDQPVATVAGDEPTLLRRRDR